MTRKYILDGHTPVQEHDLLTWARWYEEADRQVALTEVDAAKGIFVSTVFLALEGFDNREPPQLFETCILANGQCGESWRCATWEEAEAQHERILQSINAGKDLAGRDLPRELDDSSDIKIWLYTALATVIVIFLAWILVLPLFWSHP